MSNIYVQAGSTIQRWYISPSPGQKQPSQVASSWGNLKLPDLEHASSCFSELTDVALRVVAASPPKRLPSLLYIVIWHSFPPKTKIGVWMTAVKAYLVEHKKKCFKSASNLFRRINIKFYCLHWSLTISLFDSDGVLGAVGQFPVGAPATGPRQERGKRARAVADSHRHPHQELQGATRPSSL